MKDFMKYKMRKVACTPFDGQAKLHEECGVFGIYELLPAFLVACVAIVVVSLDDLGTPLLL